MSNGEDGGDVFDLSHRRAQREQDVAREEMVEARKLQLLIEIEDCGRIFGEIYGEDLRAAVSEVIDMRKLYIASYSTESLSPPYDVVRPAALITNNGENAEYGKEASILELPERRQLADVALGQAVQIDKPRSAQVVDMGEFSLRDHDFVLEVNCEQEDGPVRSEVASWSLGSLNSAERRAVMNIWKTADTYAAVAIWSLAPHVLEPRQVEIQQSTSPFFGESGSDLSSLVSKEQLAIHAIGTLSERVAARMLESNIVLGDVKPNIIKELRAQMGQRATRAANVNELRGSRGKADIVDELMYSRSGGDEWLCELLQRGTT